MVSFILPKTGGYIDNTKWRAKNRPAVS